MLSLQFLEVDLGQVEKEFLYSFQSLGYPC